MNSTNGGMIPVRLVGSDKAGNEIFIGDFPGGLGVKDNFMVDLRDQKTVAVLVARRKKNDTQPRYFWEVPKMKNRKFSYLFMQVMPSDAPVTLNLGSERRRLF